MCVVTLGTKCLRGRHDGSQVAPRVLPLRTHARDVQARWGDRLRLGQLGGLDVAIASVDALTDQNYPTLDYATITLAQASDVAPLPIARYEAGVLARVWGFGCGGFEGAPLARVLATPAGVWPWDQVEQTGMCLCPGDSGGPMVTDRGVVAFLTGTLAPIGSGEPNPHGPHLFTYADTREF